MNKEVVNNKEELSIPVMIFCIVGVVLTVFGIFVLKNDKFKLKVISTEGTVTSFTIAKNGGDGGAIYIAGLNATVEASRFNTTQSAQGKGGAIYIEGYNANVLNSTFIRANSTAGGIIYIEGNRADVLDCNMMFSSSNIIENCTGDGNGGVSGSEADGETADASDEDGGSDEDVFGVAEVDFLIDKHLDAGGGDEAVKNERDAAGDAGRNGLDDGHDWAQEGQ